MKFRPTMVFAATLFGLAIYTPAVSSAQDMDADGVLDEFDNCLTIANGANDACDQVDSDQDGFGNSCDPDYNNDGLTTTEDFVIYYFDCFTVFGGGLEICDHNCDGLTTTSDFTTFVSYFNAPNSSPGPSGLECAGETPCP